MDFNGAINVSMAKSSIQKSLVYEIMDKHKERGLVTASEIMETLREISTEKFGDDACAYLTILDMNSKYDIMKQVHKYFKKIDNPFKTELENKEIFEEKFFDPTK